MLLFCVKLTLAIVPLAGRLLVLGEINQELPPLLKAKMAYTSKGIPEDLGLIMLIIASVDEAGSSSTYALLIHCVAKSIPD